MDAGYMGGRDREGEGRTSGADHKSVDPYAVEWQLFSCSNAESS